MKKRIVSALLALVMTLTLLPLAAWAAEADHFGETEIDPDITLNGESASIAAAEDVQLSLFVGTENQELNFGDYVIFGEYNGEPLKWRVAKIDGARIMLLTASVLFNGEFDASVHEYETGVYYGNSDLRTGAYFWGSASWRTSYLRAYLNARDEIVPYTDVEFDYSRFPGTRGQYNGENKAPSYVELPGFLSENNFTRDEVDIILPTMHNQLVPVTDPLHLGGSTKHPINNNTVSKLYDGDYPYGSSSDYVYVLNAQEFLQYYSDCNKAGKSDLSYRSYWLRDSYTYDLGFGPSINLHEGTHIASVEEKGNGASWSFGAANGKNGVRPACTISSAYITGLSGEGTFDDPYRMELGHSGSPVQVDTGAYYAATGNREFDIFAATKNNEPRPVGFTVSVGDEDYTGREDDGKDHFCDTIMANIPDGYSGDITVSKDGYHTYQVPARLTGKRNMVAMFPNSVTGPFVQSLILDEGRTYKPYNNLLIEKGTFYASSALDSDGSVFFLYPIVNWNGHGAGRILLKQGDIEVELKANTFNKIDLSVSRFVAKEPVYISVWGADGVGTQSPTNINIVSARKNGLSVDMGKSMTADTSKSNNDKLDLFADQTFSMDFSSLLDDSVPISFEIGTDGTVTGTIGLTMLQGSYSEAAYGTLKESLSKLADPSLSQTAKNMELAKKLKELDKQGIKHAGSSSSIGVSGSVQLIGCFSGNFLDGRIGLTEIKTALVFEGGLKYTWTTYVFSAPVYLEMGLKTEIETYVNMKYDEQLEKMVVGSDVQLDVKVKLSAELGVGIKEILATGVKGSGTLKISTILPLSKDETSLSVKADISIVGYFFGVPGTWQVAKTPEMIFWDGGEWCWKNSKNARAMDMDWQWDDLSSELVFNPDLSVVPMSMTRGGAAFVSGVSGYAAPSLAVLPDNRLLAVWMANVSGRSAVDKNGVYYSIYDSGAWSVPKLVCEDGTNDSVPQLYQEKGTTYIAWQNYTTVFDTDTMPDYDILEAQLETVTAKFDNASDNWSKPVAEEPSWYMIEPNLPDDYEGEWPSSQTTRQVLESDELRAVLYTAEDADGLCQVYGIFSDGYGWGSPVQLTEDDEGVNGFGAALSESGLNLLYTSGDISASMLNLQQIIPEGDLSIQYVDYVRETLVPTHDLALTMSLKNNGLVPVNGANVTVTAAGAEPYQSTVILPLQSGEEDLLFINYPLPKEIDFDHLDVLVEPINAQDADISDNAAVCDLLLTDLSVEDVSAIRIDGTTQASAMVVNRGQSETASVQLTYHKGSPDGDVIGTATVPAMKAGELANITVELPGLNIGDMVYVEAGVLENENLVSNNSSQATVISDLGAELAIEDMCVKITAVYKVDGSLDVLTVEEVPRSEAAPPVRTENGLIVYWESLISMKPL
ncbi:MAG: hypothetical protein J1F63_02105 [Oscillospiraceae bacterium]|nr:hypothetical protein [Oscillospiraceae bacterium]